MKNLGLHPITTINHNLKNKLADKDNEIIEKISQFHPDHFSKISGSRGDSLQALFLYPAMMVTEGQRELIALIKSFQPNLKSVFEPFMGSGSSLVAGMQLGLDCYGQDINPLAVLLAKVKLGVYAQEELENGLKNVLNFCKNCQAFDLHNFKGIDKWFRSDVIEALSKIRNGILQENSIEVRRFLWVVLAETIRLTSNDRISTYKLHSRPQSEILERQLDPIKVFKRIATNNIKQLIRFNKKLSANDLIQKNQYIGTIQTKISDSKIKAELVGPGQFDLLVTSPPYGDNKTTITYGQHSFLPLNWIQLTDIDPDLKEDCLRSTLYIDSASLGGRTGKLKDELTEELFVKSPSLLETILNLSPNHLDKKNRVLNFFNDLEIGIRNACQALKVNAYSIWTIGNRRVGGEEVPNDKILKEFMEANNCHFVTSIDRQILKKKMASKNRFSQTMKTEKILIFRKRG